MGSKAYFRSLGFLMWIIVLAAFQFLNLRTEGWIALIPPALIIIVLIAFCMILWIVRWLDARLSASASGARSADSTVNGHPNDPLRWTVRPPSARPPRKL